MRSLPRPERLKLIEKFGYLPVSRAMASDDLSFFTVKDRKGFIGYREKGGILLVPGEPICAMEDMEIFLDIFMARSRELAKKICFFGCSERAAEEARSVGYSVIKFGQEAVLDIRNFSLKGNRMENVRRGLNHAGNVGVTVNEYPYQRGRVSELERELEEVSRDWLTSKRTPELEFLLGRTEFHRLEGRRIFTAKSRDRIEGFVILNRVPLGEGWYTDILRRRNDAPNGVIEKLIVEIMDVLRPEGARNLFLGMVPFVGIDTDAEENRKLSRLMDSMKDRMDFLYPIRPEHFFKNKFHPLWRDVYMYVYPNVSIKMIYNIVSAFLPTGVRGIIRHRLKLDKRNRPGDGMEKNE